jgi:hypothetical protein
MSNTKNKHKISVIKRNSETESQMRLNWVKLAHQQCNFVETSGLQGKSQHVIVCCEPATARHMEPAARNMATHQAPYYEFVSKFLSLPLSQNPFFRHPQSVSFS